MFIQRKSMRTWSSNRVDFEWHRAQNRLTKTVSRTEVLVPCGTTTWCTNRFPYRKQWNVQQQGVQWKNIGANGEWHNYLRVACLFVIATVLRVGRTQNNPSRQRKMSQIIHDSSIRVTSNKLNSPHISASDISYPQPDFTAHFLSNTARATENEHRATWCCENMQWELPFFIEHFLFVSPIEECQFERRAHTDTHANAHFLRFSSETHLDALRTLSALLIVKVGLPKSLHEVVLADLPYLCATETTSTTWTSWNQFAHMLFEYNSSLSGGMTIHQKKNTRYEPSSELDMAGKCVPIVDLTHDDEDTHSHMFDVPLQLPASANAASNYSALGTFWQVEGDLMRNASSFHPMPSQTGVHPWQLRYPKTYPQDSQAVLGPQETVQLVTQRAREGLTVRRDLLHQQG